MVKEQVMLYVGPLAAVSGYQVAGLGYLQGLWHRGLRGFRLHQSGMDYRRLSPSELSGYEHLYTEPETFEHWALVHERPHRVPEILEDLGIPGVGLTVFETAELPQRHVDAFLAQDLLRGLIVPSQEQANILRAQGWDRPLAVIPHTWSTVLPSWPAEWPLESSDFVFYYIGGGGRRKNPRGVVQAYYQAFPAVAPNRRLVLKISDAIAESFELREDVELHTGAWSRDQITALHRRGTCFVSAHRGEGFGLGMFEARLQGRRVICTDAGAPPYFLDPADDILVPATRCPLTDDDMLSVNFQSHFRPGLGEVSTWWRVDESALAAALVSAYEAGPRVRRVSPTVAARYSANVIGAELVSFLTQTLG